MMDFLRKYLIAISLIFLFGANSLADHEEIVHLASTTSAKSSGLLEIIIPVFESETGYKLKVTVTGSGKALRLGRIGKVDLVWVHSPEAEEKFIEDGFGVKRHTTMSNDFVIAGPADDPAHIGKENDVLKALRNIASKKALFLSRADDSGTDRREKKLWNEAEIDPYGLWYYEAGAGMGEALQMANSKKAYILVDRSTWLAMKDSLTLKLLFQGDKKLINYYNVIAVNPQRYPSVNSKGASAFIDFITSEKGHKLISNFRVKGEQLFTPVNNREHTK